MTDVPMRCGACDHRDAYHQMSASAGERRCVQAGCGCPNFAGTARDPRRSSVTGSGATAGTTA